MEKRECKLCFKTFANGRALGGHMRSHMKKLQLPSKPQESTHSPSPTLLSFEANSPSSSSSYSSEDEENKNDLTYILRDNPKRSIRTVDPEFSFVVDPNASIIQDRESETETESSKKTTRKRSKRVRKLCNYDHNNEEDDEEKAEKIKSNDTASSISDTTTEEDVAYWLMMLSRDKWSSHRDPKDRNDEEEEEEEDGEYCEEYKAMKSRNRAKYTCETCKKVFRSYQALGGHRASHKKIKLEVENCVNSGIGIDSSSSSVMDKKIHECPVCFRVFSSGQALGGHKRTHLTTLLPEIRDASTTRTKLVAENFIDLNLPAPIDEDEVSQIDNSGVSDAEFLVVHGITQ